MEHRVGATLHHHSKEACDAFYKTDLSRILQDHDTRELIVTGCATDFCVDTTVRAAASRDTR